MASNSEIEVKGRRYHVHMFTGKVVEADRNMETVVSSSGVSSDGMGNVRGGAVSSTTHTHDRLFLVNEANEERAFKFTDISLNARVGHTLQVIWLIKPGEDAGYYVMAKNLTLKEQRWIDDGLKHSVVFFYGNGFYILPFILLTIFLAFFTFGLSLLMFYWGHRYIKDAVDEAKGQLQPLINA